MRQLNGYYTQLFNRKHGLVGHLFQGRFKAVLVQKEAYLLELIRYVVLNPLRAGVVARVEDWPWSSYPACIGLVESSPWLDTDWLLMQFGSRRGAATDSYQKFVLEGRGLPSPLDDVRHQLFLGNDGFVDKLRSNNKGEELREISKAHRRSMALTLSEYR